MQSERSELPVTYQLMAWLDTHKKQAAIGAGVVFLLGLVIAFMFWSQGQKADEASLGFSKLMFERTTTPESFLQLAAEYPNTAGGANALLQAAQLSFAASKYSEAQAQFETFRSKYRNNALVSTASLGIAASLDAQGKADDALAIYEDLIARRSSDMAYVQSQYAAARLYESKKQYDKAVPLYEAVAQEDKQGRMGDDSAVRAHESSILHPAPVAPAAEAPLVPSTLK